MVTSYHWHYHKKDQEFIRINNFKIIFIMKKALLMLLSWTMIMLGAISFASCSDDDDDDDKSGANSAMVGTWVRNASESSSTSEEESESITFGDITFNADGTFDSNSTDGEKISGTYSVSGKDLTMNYTEDGITLTLAKGTVLMDMEFMGVAVKSVITDYTVEVNGNKMTMTLVVETESNGMKATNKDITVLDKK